MSHRIEHRDDALDRSRWPRGEWDSEPDTVSWIDDATGLDCLILRHHWGMLCGYVGLPPGHPMYGQHYDDVRTTDGELPSCHGGLTFAGAGPRDRHIPLPGRPDVLWWVGFDCGHIGDRIPEVLGLLGAGVGFMDTYKNLRWVEQEVSRLAAEMSCHLKQGR